MSVNKPRSLHKVHCDILAMQDLMEAIVSRVAILEDKNGGRNSNCKEKPLVKVTIKKLKFK